MNDWFWMAKTINLITEIETWQISDIAVWSIHVVNADIAILLQTLKEKLLLLEE